MSSEGKADLAGGSVCRSLRASDVRSVLALLRLHPVRNVLLEHLVQSGALGRIPGFYGSATAQGAIEAVLLIGVLGSAFIEARSRRALRGLGRLAGGLRVKPRHITGPEGLTQCFWEGYSPFAPTPRWWRSEPLYRLSRGERKPHPPLPVRRANEFDLAEIVANSARQHVEDLGEDREAIDPEGFERRHRLDLRAGHWWVAREEGGRRIAFQVHVGPQNDQVVQLGGVFTPPDLRGRGYATRALSSLAEQLLERKPGLCLFCDEANAGARRVYERVGFQVVDHYRSLLLGRSDAAHEGTE